MDFGFYFGIIFGIGSLVASIVVEKGSLAAYVNIGAFIIIIGGTLGATVISVGVNEINRLPAVLRVASRGSEQYESSDLVGTIIRFSRIARKEGLLALEPLIDDISDPFLKKGLQMVVDGFSADHITDLLEAELASMKRRHTAAAEMLQKMGGYAPTMGIIGTVLGLVNMLLSLGEGNSAGLGSAVAIAFMATLYGIFSANLVFLPIASNLTRKSDKEVAYKQVILEGVLDLQSGENPHFLETKLTVLLGEGKG